MDTRRAKIAKGIWVVISVAVLVVTVYGSGRPENRDNILVLSWAMLLLSFPSGQLVAVMYGPLSEFVPARFWLGGMSYLMFLVTWLGFFAVGYLQWFKVLPVLYAKIHSHLSRSADRGRNE